MEFVLEIKKFFGLIWLYILWILIYVYGSFKDIYYNVFFYNDCIIYFNLDMEKYFLVFGILVFDIFNLICGVWSIDGIYFGMGINMMKV